MHKNFLVKMVQFHKMIQVLINGKNIEQNVKEMDHVVHWGCNQFIDDLKHVQEGNPSSAIISILAHQHFDEWVINKPYDLVPNYISPFEVGKRKH